VVSHLKMSPDHPHHRHPGTRSARHWMVLSMLLTAGACTKTPSILWAHVSVDDNVPMLSDLRTTVVSLSHTGLEPSVQRESLLSDAGGTPAPFAFPVVIPITLNAEYVGDVSLTAEGLDRATDAVVASGSKVTTVLGSKEMHVSVTMSLVEHAGDPGGGAGGASDVGAGGAGGSP